MLNAPVPARKVLDKAGLTIDDIDVFEVNEVAVVVEKFIPTSASTATRSTSTAAPSASATTAPPAPSFGTALDELERTTAVTA